MIVSVDLATTPPDVRLDEPDDCRRFHVAARGAADPERLRTALADSGSGRLDGDDAWVQIDAVRRLAAGRVGASWESDFVAFLARVTVLLKGRATFRFCVPLQLGLGLPFFVVAA